MREFSIRTNLSFLLVDLREATEAGAEEGPEENRFTGIGVHCA
jgi:hypothetical protein